MMGAGDLGEMMQTVYLVMYLWHAAAEDMGRSAGAPVLSIVQMPSISACESVGRAAKALADNGAPLADPARGSTMIPRPASFRCVSVPHE